MTDDTTQLFPSSVHTDFSIDAVARIGGAAAEYEKILSMTQRLFPGPVNVRRKADPEFDEEYFVFKATAGGDFEDVMTRDAQWHRECRQLAPSSRHLYRLRLEIQNESG